MPANLRFDESWEQLPGERGRVRTFGPMRVPEVRAGVDYPHGGGFNARHGDRMGGDGDPGGA
jgi:hypothetical protein